MVGNEGTLYFLILLEFIHYYSPTEGLGCPLIVEHARSECAGGYGGITQGECEEQGCCWDENAQNMRCFSRDCKAGYFGWGCRFKCNCKYGEICDQDSGECPSACPRGHWGIGCLLSDDCSYNDAVGEYYMGNKLTTNGGHTCGSWSLQPHYPGKHFADGTVSKAKNFCRNPRPVDSRGAWCYYKFSHGRAWDLCTLSKCACVRGRFGVNCEKECHCSDISEDCNAITGACRSGCDPHWTGPGCQECADGRFGSQCRGECHCHSRNDVCNKITGHCQSGCANGWKGHDCQTECADGYFGFNCELRCNCKQEDEVCDKSDGSCPSGCKEGYSGIGCQFMCHCRDPKEQCNPHDGSCKSGCAQGWVGAACDIEIPSMKHAPFLRERDAKSITLRWRKWKKPPDAGDGPVTGYFVNYRQVDETEWQSVRVGSNEAVIRGLQTSATYTFGVRPVHQKNFSGYMGPQVNISTCGIPRSGPVDLKIRPKSQVRMTHIGDATSDMDVENVETKLHVEWKVPPKDTWNCDHIVRYNVYEKASINDEFEYLRHLDIHRLEIGDIDEYSNYSIGVSIINNANMESPKTAATYIGKSGKVENLQAESMGPTELYVSWDPPISPNSLIQHYILRYKVHQISDCVVESSAWSERRVISPPTKSAKLTQLHPFSKYHIRIWAMTEEGKGLTADIMGTTQGMEPSSKVRSLIRNLLKPKSATFSWQPPECEDRNGESRGYQYEIHEVGPDGMIVMRNRVNSTNVTVQNLVPYTRYTFRVTYLNHVGKGPYSSVIQFETLQDKPPAPRAVEILMTTSDSLWVTWLPPDPPHGILTNYKVLYSSGRNLGSPEVVMLGPRELGYNITGLQANTSYSIKVRAVTSVGDGALSAEIYGYTKEALPESPEMFTNLSRTTHSLTLTWLSPKRANGVLNHYKLMCSPVTLVRTTHVQLRDIQEDIPARRTMFTVEGLQPGTEYVCTLRAHTRVGYGPSTRNKFWTKPKEPDPPDMPEVVTDKSTDSSLAVRLRPSLYVSHMSDIAERMYRVVVEKHAETPEKERKKRSAEDMPCGLPRSELLPYAEAKSKGLGCYIAAEIPVVSSESLFVVGDNKTYNGYYNAPLHKGDQYSVWFGVSITVDGETVSSYTKTELPSVAAQYVVPSDGEENVLTMAVAGMAVAIILILMVFIIVVIIRRRKSRKSAIVEVPCENHEDVRNSRYDELGEGLTGMKEENAVNLPDVCSNSLEDLPQEQTETEPLCRLPEKQAIHRPISVENLWNYVKEKKQNKIDNFKTEYESFVHGLKFKCEIARLQENKNKNRYGNIVAYDESRVTLEHETEEETDYINANYIDGYRKPQAFIATQGPSKQTLNDIWKMAWQQNTHRIVMVTNLVEDGRHKCEQYWPDNEPRVFEDIRVEMVGTEQLADFTIRTFTMSKGDICKTVHQFHFTAWPDHGVPTYATSLLAFRRKVRSCDDPTAGPTIVHCSAGVGRTGTFIALDFLLDQAKVEGAVDVYHCVHLMRTKRVNMVQTLEQYIFVHDALLEALKSGDTSIPCVDFRKRYLDLCRQNPETGKLRIEEEYELLEEMSPDYSVSTCKDAFDPENITKNRFRDIIPLDNLSRPYLVTYIPGATDYINAVFVDGYRQKDAFIVTQMPLPHTLTDFWSMVYDHECKTIVMMNELDTKDETSACYWPEDVGSQQHGPFTVELVSIDTTHCDVIVRDFTVTLNKKGTDPHYLRQLQYLGWPMDLNIPPQKSSLLNLLLLVEKWQQRSGNGLIDVHCLDGASQSGLFCVVSYMLERLKVEQEVDIFQSAKHVRINRPQLIPNLEQYKFLYEMAIAYMDSFETYANFK